VPAGGLACERCARGVPLAEGVATEFNRLAIGRLHAALRQPPADADAHWRLLRLYVDYHVHELRSLAALVAPVAQATHA
jgi:hypothetical protein